MKWSISLHAYLPCVYLLGEESIKVFGSFFNQVVYFLTVEFFCVFFYYLLFLAALGLHCAQASSSCDEGGILCCGARASHCGGFSCCGARALGARASVVVARGL